MQIVLRDSGEHQAVALSREVLYDRQRLYRVTLDQVDTDDHRKCLMIRGDL